MLRPVVACLAALLVSALIACASLASYTIDHGQAVVGYTNDLGNNSNPGLAAAPLVNIEKVAGDSLTGGPVYVGASNLDFT